jgi:hypothetical protein
LHGAPHVAQGFVHVLHGFAQGFAHVLHGFAHVPQSAIAGMANATNTATANTNTANFLIVIPPFGYDDYYNAFIIHLLRANWQEGSAFLFFERFYQVSSRYNNESRADTEEQEKEDNDKNTLDHDAIGF